MTFLTYSRRNSKHASKGVTVTLSTSQVPKDGASSVRASGTEAGRRIHEFLVLSDGEKPRKKKKTEKRKPKDRKKQREKEINKQTEIKERDKKTNKIDYGKLILPRRL